MQIFFAWSWSWSWCMSSFSGHLQTEMLKETKQGNGKLKRVLPVLAPLPDLNSIWLFCPKRSLKQKIGHHWILFEISASMHGDFRKKVSMRFNLLKMSICLIQLLCFSYGLFTLLLFSTLLFFKVKLPKKLATFSCSQILVSTYEILLKFSNIIKILATLPKFGNLTKIWQCQNLVRLKMVAKWTSSYCLFKLPFMSLYFIL